MANPALEVLLNGRVAGTLLRKGNGNLQFRYDEAYVEADGPIIRVVRERGDAGKPATGGAYARKW